MPKKIPVTSILICRSPSLDPAFRLQFVGARPGDIMLSSREGSSPIYDALKRRGLEPNDYDWGTVEVESDTNRVLATYPRTQKKPLNWGRKAVLD